MSDGPFRNLKLSRRWKRFAEAAQNDTVDAAKRHAMAADALVHEILTDDTVALLNFLHTRAKNNQLDLDPVSSFEDIFNGHHKSPFADILQKELSWRLNEGMPAVNALNEALGASVKEQATEAHNHIVEECIRANEAGEMHQDQFIQAINQSRLTLNSLDTSEICDALRAGNKQAFKTVASRKNARVSEGPSL